MPPDVHVFGFVLPTLATVDMLVLKIVLLQDVDSTRLYKYCCAVLQVVPLTESMISTSCFLA